MGVITTGREYYNNYRAELVDWLLGNTGDWQKISLTVRFGVEKKYSVASPCMIEPDKFINGDGTDFSSYGFDVGDVFTYEYDIVTGGGSTHYTGTRTVTLIAGDTMEYSGGNLTGFPMLPYNNGTTEVKNFQIWVDKQPQGAILTYGHLQNADADSYILNSFIDGTLTRLAALNMDTLVGYQPMEYLALQSGMSIKDAAWVYWGKIGTHYYQYNFSFHFMLSSFFESLSNFELQEPPSMTFDAASLTDNFHIQGFPEWNNPNTRMENDLSHTKRLGNTGWFNENFNGLDDDFVVSSVTYEDVATATPTSKLSHGSATKVTATIQGIQNLADGLSSFGLGFIWLPEDESYYKELDSPFHENMKVNTAGSWNQGVFLASNLIDPATYQGYSTDGLIRMDVSDVRFQISGSDVIYEAIFTPTPEFKIFMDSLPEAERNYALWVSCADRTLVTNFSNRVSKLLDYNRMELYVPPLGAYDGMVIDYFEHPHDGTEDMSKACGYDMYVEDDILSRVRFKIDLNDPIPEALEFGIVAENTTTGQVVQFQSYPVSLTGYPTDGMGVPQWAFDASRGFKYEAGNNKNWVKVEREPALDSGGEYAYVAYYGFKIRWEDWIARTGLPNDFFDAAEENNGFNNDWYHALQVAGWDFKFVVYTSVTIDGQAGKYVNTKPLEFNDYDSNPDVNTTWNFYRESDGALINAGVDAVTGKPLGIILDEPVRVQIIFDRLSGTWVDLNDVYATSCIEVDRGAGQFSFRQLSSIWGSESDNPLVPLAGETKLKLTLASPTQIIAECLVEPSLLEEATRYKHTSRLGYRSVKENCCEGMLYEHDNCITLENGNTLIIE